MSEPNEKTIHEKIDTVIGMPWLHTQKSGLLLGVGEDAAYLAASIS